MAHLTIEEPEHSGMNITRNVLRSLQRGEALRFVRRNYRLFPRASLDAARLGYYARMHKRRIVSNDATVTLRVDCEQSTKPGTRIRVAEREVDLLGIPRTIIDWRVSDEEISCMRSYARFLRQELNWLGLRSIYWDPQVMDSDSGRFPEVRDTNHPMGGTVTGTDPRTSVVDHNLQIHGVPNLHIASCSTFPSGGSSNPTFTMMALTLRLSKRIKQAVSSNGL